MAAEADVEGIASFDGGGERAGCHCCGSVGAVLGHTRFDLWFARRVEVKVGRFSEFALPVGCLD